MNEKNDETKMMEGTNERAYGTQSTITDIQIVIYDLFTYILICQTMEFLALLCDDENTIRFWIAFQFEWKQTFNEWIS